MEKDDLNDIDDLDDGIELDKIEVPKRDSVSIAQKPAKVPTSEKTANAEPDLEFEAAPAKGAKFKIIVAVSVVGLAAALFLLWNLNIIKFAPGSGKEKNVARPAPANHTIDPIITNLGENQRIKISLMIKNDVEFRKQISKIEPIIRDRILMFLTSADTKKMINESDLKKLKLYIRDYITHLLQSNYNGKIVLKELKIY